MSREELKSKIPHGYASKIAEKAGVTTYTVSLFLNGKSNNIGVEMAALEIVAELEQKRKALVDIING